MSIALALCLAGGIGAYADPPNVGSTTVTTPTVSTPDVTPDGNLIPNPAPPVYTVPPALVKAKSFTRSLYIRKETRWLTRKIRQYRNSAAKWALVRGAYISSASRRSLAESGLPALKRQLRLVIRLDNRQRVISQHPPHLAGWLCIHGHEGSWNDTGAPYWGGLQMSLDFQQTYAPRLYRALGTADHWTPLEQMWAAERAARTRGFWPWPNTARMCGLL